MTMGGHFDYVGETVHEILDEVGENAEVRRRFPILAEIVKEVGAWFEEIEEEIDNDLDQEYRDVDQEFDLARAMALVNRVAKLIPEGHR